MVRTRTARVAVGAVAVALAAALGGCGGDDGGGGEASPTPAEPTKTTASPTPSPTGEAGGATTVQLRSTDELGEILTDADGRTLYLFVADSSEESTCYDSCADAWPPLTAKGEPKAGKGAEAGLLGTTKRTDGSTQVTYNGHPLYLYENDEEPGDTTGQALDQFGAEWFVLDASGNEVDEQEQEPEQEPEPDPDGRY